MGWVEGGLGVVGFIGGLFSSNEEEKRRQRVFSERSKSAIRDANLFYGTQEAAYSTTNISLDSASVKAEKRATREKAMRYIRNLEMGLQSERKQSRLNLLSSGVNAASGFYEQLNIGGNKRFGG